MKLYLSRSSNLLTLGLMTLALVGLTVLTALAASRPFHLVEHGSLTVSNGLVTAEGTGTATHLGRMSVHRTFTLTPASEGTNLEVNGQATLSAANGDRLESTIKGTLDPQTGQAILVYEWQGGTGQFQNATGTTVWRVQVNADQTYDVVADGVINY